ncbi:PadR family transcriptional regulator, partial [Photobacterium sp. OFAV2-7]|uniref:PadR family transcriptional regulator n=1 Tax=Photobacterium sp. OFAV2-7 TaxID=2917748 RepID=UPI001EF4ECB9
MISNLQIVLLSKLLEQPRTGYDLTKLIKKSPWHASHQQVYRELARLERKMMVTSKEIPQQGKPDKKSYSITASGRIALADPELLQPVMKKMQDDASAML